MNDLVMIFLSVIAGYLMAMVSGFAGAYLTCKIMGGKGGSVPFVPEPAGEVFTIEEPDDMTLFPDEGKDNKAEEHILERTNKFLQALGGDK